MRGDLFEDVLDRLAASLGQLQPRAAQLQDVQTDAGFIEHVHRRDVAALRGRRQARCQQAEQIQHACGEALAVLLAAAFGRLGQGGPALPYQPSRGPFGTDRAEQPRHHHGKPNADEHRDRRVGESLDVGTVGVLQAQQRSQVDRQRQREQRALRVVQKQAQRQEHHRQHQRQQAEVVHGGEHAEQVYAGHQ
ncbi:hypothetical protein D3C73_1252200 [compost metagenome]